VVNRDLLSAKLAELADRLARVSAHRKPSAEELAASRDSTDIVAFNRFAREVAAWVSQR
jgi:hypothetical protein